MSQVCNLIKKDKKFSLWQNLFSINPGQMALIALCSFNVVLIKFSLFLFRFSMNCSPADSLIVDSVFINAFKILSQHNFSFQPSGTLPIFQEWWKISFSV